MELVSGEIHPLVLHCMGVVAVLSVTSSDRKVWHMEAYTMWADSMTATIASWK